MQDSLEVTLPSKQEEEEEEEEDEEERKTSLPRWSTLTLAVSFSLISRETLGQ